MSIPAYNAARSEHYAKVTALHGDPRPDALPEWDDLTIGEKIEHYASCIDGCDFCADDTTTFNALEGAAA